MNISIAKVAHLLAIVVFIIATVGGSVSDWNLVPLGLGLYVGGDLLEDLVSGE